MVGSLDAEYDFKDLDPKYHSLALQLIPSRNTYYLPSNLISKQVKEIPKIVPSAMKNEKARCHRF